MITNIDLNFRAKILLIFQHCIHKRNVLIIIPVYILSYHSHTHTHAHTHSHSHSHTTGESSSTECLSWTWPTYVRPPTVTPRLRPLLMSSTGRNSSLSWYVFSILCVCVCVCEYECEYILYCIMCVCIIKVIISLSLSLMQHGCLHVYPRMAALSPSHPLRAEAPYTKVYTYHISTYYIHIY